MIAATSLLFPLREGGLETVRWGRSWVKGGVGDGGEGERSEQVTGKFQMDRWRS